MLQSAPEVDGIQYLLTVRHVVKNLYLAEVRVEDCLWEYDNQLNKEADTYMDHTLLLENNTTQCERGCGDCSGQGD